MTVVTTAPSYLFWRCAPPELRVPRALPARRSARAAAGRSRSGRMARPRPARRCASSASMPWCAASARRSSPRSPRPPTGRACPRSPIAIDDGDATSTAPPACQRFVDLPPLAGPTTWIARHHHHHHRFDEPPARSRRRGRGLARLSLQLQLLRQDRLSATNTAGASLPLLLAEIDRLIAQGVGYLYFIDEIFLPQKPLLEALVAARGAVRRADPHRPVEAGDAGAARRAPAASRSRPASRA